MNSFGGLMPDGGINQNTLNDFNRLQAPSPQFTMGENSVKLYVFMPRDIPVQVARPFVYQFTPDLIDGIKTQVSGANAVANGDPATVEAGKRAFFQILVVW